MGFIRWRVSSQDRKVLLAFFKDKTSSDLSNRVLKGVVERGVFRVNGSIEAFSSRRLKVGDIVLLYDGWKALLEKKYIKSLDILYEDDQFIVVDKPPFLTCTDLEIKKYFKGPVLLVHRLDRETSGVLVVAKSLKIKNLMKKLFFKKLVKKVYIAVVDGEVKRRGGRIELFLSKRDGASYKVSKKGLYSLTNYEVIRRKKTFSVVRCIPITGRTHQIRVHMKQLGHPILGDYKYSRNFIYKGFVERVLLHSQRIIFKNPITGKIVDVKAPLPAIFRSFR